MTKSIDFLPLGAMAEKDLVAGLCRGEAASYRHLYDRFAPRLQRILLRIFADPQLASDAVQASFLIVFEKVGRFDGRAALLTWLTRIAINEAHALRKKSARRPNAAAFHEETAPSPRNPEQEHGDRELQCQLQALIKALPEDKRTSLLLFEVEGFSVQEIADITGEPRGTVLARLSRTRAELQKELRGWSGFDERATASTSSKVRGREHV
jgi:RNA polymerase sigma-70 factor (ECF subfamily)